MAMAMLLSNGEEKGLEETSWRVFGVLVIRSQRGLP